jgi:hypothetical protein
VDRTKPNESQIQMWDYVIALMTLRFLLLKILNLWPESASELYRPSDLCLSAKLVSTFADRGCNMISVMDPYGRIIAFLDRTLLFLSSNSSVVVMRLNGPRSKPTTS